MFFLKKLLTALALPPTSLLILALFGLWLTRRHPRSGRWLASLAFLGLFVLSLPIVSTALLCSLEAQAPVTARQLARAQTIVVLGGGVYHQTAMTRCAAGRWKESATLHIYSGTTGCRCWSPAAHRLVAGRKARQ